MTQIPVDSRLFRLSRPAAEHPQARRQTGRVRRGQDRQCDAARSAPPPANSSAPRSTRWPSACLPTSPRCPQAASPTSSTSGLSRTGAARAGYYRTARAYIAYREQHRRLREDSRTAVDVESSINEYWSGATGVSTPTQPGLFARRPDPERVGQGGGQLLAQPRLCARSRARPPRGRHPHPRPGHARRLLRRLVAAHAAARRPETACPARSRRPHPSTCLARSGRSSISSARCKTSGRGRRRSPPSTPTWRPTSARTTCPTKR